MKTQAGTMRHTVNVMRPAATQDDVGGTIGQPTCIRRDVPCSIETLTGVEAERVHSSWPSVTKKIEMYADPARQVTPNMYLAGGSLKDQVQSDGTTKPRYLNIVAVIDAEEKGLKLTLFCDEEV